MALSLTHLLCAAPALTVIFFAVPPATILGLRTAYPLRRAERTEHVNVTRGGVVSDDT